MAGNSTNDSKDSRKNLQPFNGSNDKNGNNFRKCSASESTRNPNSYDKASLISRLYCLYGFHFLWKHYRKDFDLDSFDECSKRERCERLGNQLNKNWQTELRKGPKRASLFRAFLKTFFGAIFWSSIINLIVYGCIRMLMPILLGRFIHFVNLYREQEFIIVDQNGTISANETLPSEQEPSHGLEWLDSLAISETDHYANSLFYAGMLAVAIFLNFAISHPYYMENFRIGMDVRIAMTRLIYEKALRIHQSAIQRLTIGKIVNLISTDASRFDVCFTAVYFVHCAIPHCAIAMFFLYLYIGPAFLGVLIMIFFYVPLQAIMANILSRLRSKSILLTDDRLRLMAEILPAMRVIKMYCWEKPFARLVHVARRLEISKIRQSMILRSINLAFFFVSNKLMAFVCIIWFISRGEKITAEIVFVSLSLIFQIRESMTFFFPMAVSYTVESYISIRRIESFLLEEEKDQGTVPLAICSSLEKKSTEPSISLKSVTVESDLDEMTILKNITFDVKPGQLTVIIGQVGSGKSTILLSILRELHLKSGTINTNGSIIYASQEAWIFSGTVRENILFGRDFDPKRYWKVVKVSALESDIEQFPQGDQTMVEDRGTSLSGGQRARLSLARALYTDSDCYLLDDPLSAVDTAVAKHIFEKCIKKYLRNKVVILVTHQLQFIKQADQIVVLKNGSCLAVGSYQVLLNKGIDVFKYSASEPTPATIVANSNDPNSPAMVDQSSLVEHAHVSPRNSLTGSTAPGVIGPISQSSHFIVHRINSFNSELFHRSRTSSMISTTTSLGDNTSLTDYQEIGGGANAYDKPPSYEQMENGGASGADNGKIGSNSGIKSSKIYWIYLRTGAGFFLLITFLLSNVLCQLFYTGTDYWLSAWTEFQENSDIQAMNPNHTFDRNPIIHEDYHTNIIIYSLLVVILFVLAIVRTVTFFVTCMRASVNLHNSIFSSLIEAPIMFFDKTPVGVIMNRVSRDLGIIDDLLPPVAFEAIEILGNSFAVFILCATLNYFILIPFFILAVFLLLDIKFYVNTARNIKRLEAQARSPLFSQMATTLVGLPTIRSYHAEEMFVDRFTRAQDVHSSVLLTFLTSSRLFGISMEVMCVLYIYSLIAFLVFNLDAFTGSIIGLTVSQSLSLTSNFNWGVRQSTEVETYMTSVERILEFGRLEREDLDQPGPQEPDDESWPQEGKIKFENVSLQYHPMDEPVLKNLTFKIRGGEKIGIVGRTGAGKSTIISTLFRLTQPSGLIEIDGIDTGKISLTRLRRNLAIIPQEPILFSGDIRRNLDPFHEKSDDELWDAVEKVQLKSKINSLDAPVAECGNDFSVGQKQLICLARAIVRKNRILILDEATANVDQKTDSFIQDTIRKEFEQCTVLTIAHRLNTIIDYDKVLVLDHGRLMQFDTPYNLISQESGIFFELYSNYSSDMKNDLRRIAKQSHKRLQEGGVGGSLSINPTLDDHITIDSPLKLENLQFIN